MKNIFITLLLLGCAALASAEVTSIAPKFGATEGGERVVIRGTHFEQCRVTCPAPEVLFGGQPATILSLTAQEIVVLTPSTPTEGKADVELRNFAVGSERLEQSYTYVRVLSEDADIHLLPLGVYGLIGANGSIWDAEVWIGNQTSEPVVFTFYDCRVSAGCMENATLPPHSQRREYPDAPRGALMYDHGFHYEEKIDLQLRFRDRNRQAQSAGVELPIVPLREFFADEMNLLGIPTDARYRTTLRVYAPKCSATARLTVFDEDGTPVTEETLQLQCLPPPTTHGYAQLSLDPKLPKSGFARVRITPETGTIFWSFVSVTNNETSEVTILTPSVK